MRRHTRHATHVPQSPCRQSSGNSPPPGRQLDDGADRMRSCRRRGISVSEVHSSKMLDIFLLLILCVCSRQVEFDTCPIFPSKPPPPPRGDQAARFKSISLQQSFRRNQSFVPSPTGRTLFAGITHPRSHDDGSRSTEEDNGQWLCGQCFGGACTYQPGGALSDSG